MYSVVHRFIRIHYGLGLTTLALFTQRLGNMAAKTTRLLDRGLAFCD